MRRRRFLAAATASLGAAGCLSSDDASESNLGSVLITNRHDRTHPVDFRVEWEGELVHDRSYEVGPDTPVDGDGHVSPERTWPETPGQFTVSARTSDGEWREGDPADRGYPECYAVIVSIDQRGGIGLFASGDPRECSEEAIGTHRPANGSGG